MRLSSPCLDYAALDVESNWTHRGAPLEDGWLAIHWGLWELYWKPLRKQDISDHKELEK